ncbi:MAG: type II toxin-antitoxin system PemK/MazF family toxin [Oscillospiraceae bacterium]|nr:type II toxin-antitoxin system PemK/MazF family toxin [Oscillospiraceae bacterium]
MEIHRGDIFYIAKGYSTGSEIFSGRPGIIVSNDKQNRTSAVVEVVFLTTKQKIPMDTHICITSAPRPSTAICEQINSVAVERLGEWAGKVTKAEMDAIERGLLHSLGMDKVDPETQAGTAQKKPEQTGTDAEVWKAKFELIHKMYEDLLERVTG